MKKRYVLDSYALLAYFQGEHGGAKVKEILKEASLAKALIHMSAINVGEVVYITSRKLGKVSSQALFKDIFLLPVQLVEASMERVLIAANIKARYPISYGDSFAVALAKELGATVVTGDPELRKVENEVGVLWL